MATTAVFFATIIIGLQVIVWTSLLLSIFLGGEWLQALKELSDWVIIGSVLFVGLAYTLGLICNRVSEELFFKGRRAIKFLETFYEIEHELKPGRIRVYVWIKDPKTADRLEVWARECALLRSTCFNVPWICIFGIILMTVWGFSWPSLVGGLSLSILIVILVFWAWGQAVTSYSTYLVRAFEQLDSEKSPNSSPNSPPRATS